ncbi:uncharacterized protein LAJ45_03429 [Morchella importuna]|uniref:uncharacterized protein n=1 Tax=Morchella importuna TaxID=1174673 RepID=UPI001E8CD4AA|nr:uncharacterized protein LAJ45_03429 [Morchella importuna]KAH8152588.1 hypothetical protein LAJ45_03429 [Morchella importuna]
MSKILVVFGATGNQGGSVIRSVLADPKLSKEFKIRGVTRDPSKPAAQKLAEQGVDVVKADLLDKGTLRNALIGAHSVFAVTNYWEKASKEIEVTQGKNISDVSKEIGVEHLIWSSLPNVTKLTDGKLSNVPHFDGKAEVEEYINALGVPATFFLAGFYMQNLKSAIKLGEDGKKTLAFTFPGDTEVPLFEASADTGKFIAAILSSDYAKPRGKQVLGASGWFTPNEIITTFEEVTGQPAKYVQLPEEVFRGFLPEAFATEMLENFALIRDYQYYGPNAKESLEESLKILNQPPTSFKEFVQRNGPWE